MSDEEYVLRITQHTNRLLSMGYNELVRRDWNAEGTVTGVSLVQGHRNAEGVVTGAWTAVTLELLKRLTIDY